MTLAQTNDIWKEHQIKKIFEELRKNFIRIGNRKFYGMMEDRLDKLEKELLK